MGNNFQETKQSLGQRMFENCLVWCDFRKRKGISITLGHAWLLCVERNEAMRFFFFLFGRCSIIIKQRGKQNPESVWLVPLLFLFVSNTVFWHRWPFIFIKYGQCCTIWKTRAPSIFQVENEVGTKEIRIPGSGIGAFHAYHLSYLFWPTLEQSNTHITAD